MPTKVSLRPLSPDERQAVEALARSRTDEARTVERARIIAALADGAKVAVAARQLGISAPRSTAGSPGSTSRGPPAWRTSPEPDAPPSIRPSRSPRSWPPR